MQPMDVKYLRDEAQLQTIEELDSSRPAIAGSACGGDGIGTCVYTCALKVTC